MVMVDAEDGRSRVSVMIKIWSCVWMGRKMRECCKIDMIYGMLRCG
jgi:hypothetical protein